MFADGSVRHGSRWDRGERHGGSFAEQFAPFHSLSLRPITEGVCICLFAVTNGLALAGRGSMTLPPREAHLPIYGLHLLPFTAGSAELIFFWKRRERR